MIIVYNFKTDLITKKCKHQNKSKTKHKNKQMQKWNLMEVGKRKWRRLILIILGMLGKLLKIISKKRKKWKRNKFNPWKTRESNHQKVNKMWENPMKRQFKISKITLKMRKFNHQKYKTKQKLKLKMII